MPTIADAKQNGFDDVLWMLDDYIKEFTVMNVFVVWKSRYGEVELITPSIDGCIFNGTLRKSLVEMKDKIFKEKGVKLVERQISIHEIINAFNEGRMLEIFGTSTSSSILSVSRVVYKETNIELGNENPIASYLNNTIIAIKQGDSEHPWITAFE